MLRALAIENPLFKPTSGKTVQTHGFASPSSSKSALTYLVDRDHAAQNKDGSYFLVDRFLGMDVVQASHDTIGEYRLQQFCLI